jgi:hypothetical protein
MTVALIKKDEAEQHADPLRTELGAAILAEAEAHRAVDSARENLERGKGALAAVQAELERARTLVDRAKERDGRAAAASIRKTASAPSDASKTVRGARLRVQELEDDVEIAEAAIGRLQDDVAQAEAALRQAVVDRLSAANAALAPICRALLDRTRAARRDSAVGKALLLLLLNDPAREAPEFRNDALGGMRAREQITAPLSGLRAEAESATMNSTAEERAAVEAAAAEMRAFVDRLATDASAEPPAIP